MPGTLGEAWRLGWRVRVRCNMSGENWRALYRDLSLPCHSLQELDMKSLLWTRGEAMPLRDLEERLKCPICGTREVIVMWEIPSPPKRAQLRV